MPQLIECVPNISEGRQSEVIARAAAAVSNIPGVHLLGQSSDPDHNRTVLTLAGGPLGLREAIHRLFAICVAEIDMRAHLGEHPRMGAVDVVPFIPIRNASLADCIALSREIGESIALEFGVPIYLYASSATHESRRRLPDIRSGGFEGMASKMGRPGWTPDFGPSAPHPTAGVCAIGARRFLIAYNIALETPDVGIAKAVARVVRESSGGLPGVQAMGVYLTETGHAQVSMNLLDFDQTPLHVVHEAVRAEAERLGTRIFGSEIVGLVPQAALIAAARHYLQIENFRSGLVLENAIEALAK